MEERGYPSSTGFLLGNCIPTNSYVQCDLCYLPLCQGKQEGASSVFQGGEADTGFLTPQFTGLEGDTGGNFGLL